LEAIYQALETSRQGIQGALAIVSGGEAPTMGAGPAPSEPDMVGKEGPEIPPSADLGSGPEGVSGREKRESVDYSRRLGMLLASKKK
jgi:hypothetical protein